MKKLESWAVEARDFLVDFLNFCDGNPFREDNVNDHNHNDTLYSYCLDWNKMHPDEEVTYSHGMTRTVLVCDNFVIKRDTFRRSNWKRYCGGCENEIEAYKFACKSGFEYLFCPIQKIRVITPKFKGFFYVMPKLIFSDLNNVYSYFEDLVMDMEDEEGADFLQEYFHDLHDENFMFDYATDSYKLIDYAANDISR